MVSDMFDVMAVNITYFLNLKNITWNNFWSLNLKETTVTEDDSLQCKSLLQLVDNRSCLEFLDETDSGVEEEKGANNTEIDPILETCGENGSSL